jgi:hypothetical protein
MLTGYTTQCIMPIALLILCLLLVTDAVSTEADRTVVTGAKADVDNDGILDPISVKMGAGRRYRDKQLWWGGADKYEGTFVRRRRRCNSTGAISRCLGKAPTAVHAISLTQA